MLAECRESQQSYEGDTRSCFLEIRAGNGEELTIEFNEGETRATITDNGKGFELPKTLGEFSRSGKLGLAGMEERARLLGGSLTVQSEPRKGTTVIVEAPI